MQRHQLPTSQPVPFAQPPVSTMMLARRPHQALTPSASQPVTTKVVPKMRGPSPLTSAPSVARLNSKDSQTTHHEPQPQASPQSIVKSSIKKGLNSEACLMLLNATMENERSQIQSQVESLVIS